MRPFGYKVDLNDSFATFLLIINMACEYHNEAKLKFPFPEYPQEGEHDDSIPYKRCRAHLTAACSRLRAQCDEWVGCDGLRDIRSPGGAGHHQSARDTCNSVA